MILLIGILFFLIIPFTIVGIWRSRPVWAFLVATTVLFLTAGAPGIIKTFQAMMIYGSGDPQLIAGGISEAMTNAFILTVVGTPILAIFQWIVRRNYKKKNALPDIDETFS